MFSYLNCARSSSAREGEGKVIHVVFHRSGMSSLDLAGTDTVRLHYTNKDIEGVGEVVTKSMLSGLHHIINKFSL